MVFNNEHNSYPKIYVVFCCISFFFMPKLVVRITFDIYGFLLVVLKKNKKHTKEIQRNIFRISLKFPFRLKKGY